MNKIILTCITCSKKVEVESNLVGEIVVCPFCSSMIFVSPAVIEESVSVPPELSAIPPVVAPPVQFSVAPSVVSLVSPAVIEPPVVLDSMPPVITQETSYFTEEADNIPTFRGVFLAYRYLFALAGIVLVLLLLIPIAIFYTGSHKEKETALVNPTAFTQTDSTQLEPSTATPPSSNTADTTIVTESEEDVPNRLDNQSIIDETIDNLLTDSIENTDQGDPSTASSGNNLIDSPDSTATTPSPATGLPGRKSSHSDAESVVDSDNENSPDNDFLAGSGATQNLRSALSAITGTVKDAPSAEQLLALSVESISLPHSNIISLMNLISTIGGAPIVFDPGQIGLLRPLWDQTFSINQEHSTLKKLLNEGTSKSMMQQREQDGIVFLEPQMVGEPQLLSIDLADMISSESKSVEGKDKNPDNTILFLSQQLTKEELSQMIRLMIPPSTDDSNTIQWQEGTITIQGTPTILETTKRLIDQLRTIRHLNPISGYSNEMLIPEILAWDKLTVTSAITTIEPIALAELIDLLGSRYQIRFLFDDHSLAQVGVTRQTRINVRTEESSVAQLLNIILTPLDLGWVIFGEDLIEISSREKASNYSTIEVHLFAIPDRKEIDESELRTLIKQVQDGIPQAMWGNETIDPPGGVIVVDWPSSCLIVRQNQPVQRQIRDWLERHLQSLGMPVLNDGDRKLQESETTP